MGVHALRSTWERLEKCFSDSIAPSPSCASLLLSLRELNILAHQNSLEPHSIERFIQSFLLTQQGLSKPPCTYMCTELQPISSQRIHKYKVQQTVGELALVIFRNSLQANSCAFRHLSTLSFCSIFVNLASESSRWVSEATSDINRRC